LDSLKKTDINQSLKTNLGRSLDALQPCFTDSFDFYVNLDAYRKQ